MARPCGSGNGVTGATKLSYFQTFQKKIETARLSRPTGRRRDFKKSFSGLSRPRWRRRDFHDQGGYGATQETARLQRQRRDRLGQGDQNVHFQDFRHRSGGGTSLQTEAAETARLFRPRRRGRDFPDQCGDGATFQTEVETVRPRLYSLQMRWIRCDFPYQCGDGATFQTKAERAILSRPSLRRRDQEIIPRYQGGGGETFQNKAETARLFRPMLRRRDFSDQGVDGATFQTEVETARPRLYSSRLRWIRCDFPDDYIYSLSESSKSICTTTLNSKDTFICN